MPDHSGSHIGRLGEFHSLGGGGAAPYPTAPGAPKAVDDGGKVTLWNAVTGEKIERWSIDARVLVASSDWTTAPPPAPAA